MLRRIAGLWEVNSSEGWQLLRASLLMGLIIDVSHAALRGVLGPSVLENKDSLRQGKLRAFGFGRAGWDEATYTWFFVQKTDKLVHWLSHQGQRRQ